MEQKNVRLFPAVLATGIMSFAGVLIETAMNVTFPTLTKEFGVSTGTVQWVTTIYLLVISIMVPLSNYLLKTYSLRRLFIVANLFFLIGLAIDVYSPSFSILLLGRLFQGASTGIALPLMFHIILNSDEKLVVYYTLQKDSRTGKIEYSGGGYSQEVGKLIGDGK